MIQKIFWIRKIWLGSIKSFYIKDELNPKVWEGFDINENVREALLAEDFYGSTELNAVIKMLY
jgi:hypothetical protein